MKFISIIKNQYPMCPSGTAVNTVRKGVINLCVPCTLERSNYCPPYDVVGVIEMDNNCCPDRPILITKTVDSEEYSATCSCGGQCTSGTKRLSDAIRQYERLNAGETLIDIVADMHRQHEEEKTSKHTTIDSILDIDKPGAGEYSEVSTSYLRFICDSDLTDRILDEIRSKDNTGTVSDRRRRVTNFILEAYRAGYAAGKAAGMEETLEKLSDNIPSSITKKD